MLRRKPLTGIVSIHDVMPQTLDNCLAIIEQLAAIPVAPITLLVVPGRRWTESDLATLRQLQNHGLLLAGHGWHHQVNGISTLYHRVHSALLSRLAAEHLSYPAARIRELIGDCHAWFARHELRTPSLYVPPAWALGALRREELRHLAFDHYELLGGVYNCHGDGFRALPLAGYEADNRLRRHFLRFWNQVNLQRSRLLGQPLRIGIHPYDTELLLRDQLFAQLLACDRFISYDDLFLEGQRPDADSPSAA